MIVRRATTDLGKSVARFSDCDRYRYGLVRRWASGPMLLFVMLNPSTADEFQNDPTVGRCQRRAVQMQYGAFAVANLFALRSTDPAALLSAADPVGPKNDVAIRRLCSEAELVICAWGNHRAIGNRGTAVLQLIRHTGHEPKALRLNRDGSPAHPLYLPYSLSPVPME